MGKRLLIETMPVAFTILEEAKKENGGRMKVRGIFGAMDEINGNGRVYPEAIMDREIEKIKPLMEDRCLYCEADHPEDGKSRIRFTAAMPVSIEKKTIDGRKVYIGEAVILNTDQGKNLQEIIRAGGKIGVSQRGFGDTTIGKWQGKDAEIVEDSYRLKTFDFVIGQSTAGATVTELSEQLDFEKVWEDIRLRTPKVDVINLIEAGRCEGCRHNCSHSTKGGASPMDLAERLAKQIVENLFSGSPSIPHAKINGSLEEILASNKDLVLISEDDQTEFTRLLDEAKKADSGDGKSLFGVGFVLGRLIEKKTGSPVKTLKEHQEPRYLTEDTHDRFRVLTELLLSKEARKKGRALTEQEANEVGKHIREGSYEGRKLILLKTIHETYPDARIVTGFKDRVFFESDGEFFMAGYLIEAGKAKLSGIEEVELAFVPSGTLEPRHKGLLGTTLQEQEYQMRQQDLRVAGLEKPPEIKTDPIDPKLLTEEMHRNRRVAGLE